MKTKLFKNSIIFGVLLALCFLACLILASNSNVAFADSNSEFELNNTASTANQISVNTSVSGNLSTSNDVDWFKFTTTQDGYFNVSFEHTFLSSTSSYWKIYIYDNTAVNNIDGGTDSYFTSAGNSNSTSNTFGVAAGTFYIKIVRYDSYNYSANDYKIKVNFKAANDWEIENNNTKETANRISVNKKINGALSRSGDTDWFVFTTPQNGYFNITFEHVLLASSSSYWKIFIYDDSGVNNIDGGMDTSYTCAGNSNRTTNTYGVKAGTYYIKVVRYDSYSYSANPYSVVVNFTTSEDWEVENNNTKETANSISLNQIINGSLTRSGDTDWYSFDVLNSREVAITFNHPLMASGSRCWKIYLYNNTGVTELLKWDIRGDTESATSDYVNIAPGRYYIKVERYDSYNYSSLNYALCLVERHDHIGVWETTLAPSCTETGTSSRTCTICGLLETQEIEAQGHSYDSGINKKEATITQKGEILFTCSRCGDQYIKKDGHLLWVIPVICVGGVILIIGLLNYIRMLKRKRP